jgi:hypothetical protein
MPDNNSPIREFRSRSQLKQVNQGVSVNPHTGGGTEAYRLEIAAHSDAVHQGREVIADFHRNYRQSPFKGYLFYQVGEAGAPGSTDDCITG